MIRKFLATLGNAYFRKTWEKKHAQKLEQFRNIHAGEDCFIIGNGPSLNKMDLTLLNDYYTFGLNKIYLIFDRMPFNLSYHVAVNPYVIKQIKGEIDKLDCPSFLSYVPAKRNNLNSDTIFYLGDRGINSFFYRDITQGVAQGHTVTYVAMQLAYFMGFKRVFLIGVDHNFQQRGNPNELQKLTHNDPNHFDPNYFKGQKWQLADLEMSEIFYLIAKYYYEKDGRKIYDATVDGKLEIFEKISFNEALSQIPKAHKHK